MTNYLSYRPSECSIGSLVRLVLGTHRKQWYLALDHKDDKGKCKRQERHWSDLPPDVTQKLQACNTSAGWYVRMDLVGGLREKTEGQGTVAWCIAGVNQAMETSFLRWSSDTIENGLQSIINATNPSVEMTLALGERNGSCCICYISDTLHLHNLTASLTVKILNKDTGSIKTIRLFHDGAFFIQNDQGDYEFGGAGIPTACWRELSQGLPVCDLAVSADNEWVILRPDTFVASQGIDPILWEHLDEFYRCHLLERRGRQQVKLSDERHRQALQQVELAEQVARTARSLHWLARHPPSMLKDLSEHHGHGEQGKRVVVNKQRAAPECMEARGQVLGPSGLSGKGAANRRIQAAYKRVQQMGKGARDVKKAAF
jgi:hypothetical protein